MLQLNTMVLRTRRFPVFGCRRYPNTLYNYALKGKHMKRREKQRNNRRIKEEMLEYKDICDLNDPTPHEAVKELIKEFKKKQR